MLLNRVPLLLISTLVLLGSAWGASPAKLDPHDLLASIRRLQHSSDPEAKAIVRQIENGPHELALQRAAARREGIPLSPAELERPSPPFTFNAAPVYWQLKQVLREKPMDERGQETLSWMGTRYAHTPEELGAARQFLADRRDVMDLVHRAADRPQCVFPRAWDRGLGLIFPEQALMRNAERLLIEESYLLGQQGRYSEAITNQARGFRIAEHAASDPTTIALLVGIACDAVALGGMEDILYLAGPNAEVADQVRTTLAACRPHFSLRYALRGEIVITLISIKMLRRASPKELAEFLTGKPAPHFRKPVPGEQTLSQKLWDTAEADYLRQMRRVMALADQEYPACIGQFRRLNQQYREFYSAPTDQPARLLLAVFAQFFEPTAVNVGRNRAREEVVIAGSAVLAYRAHHGAWPDRLEEALSDLPLDPFSGEPVKYRREGEGFVVYSVGPSGKFDGRAPEAGRHASEVYFRYPAPPPQPRPS